MAQDLHAVALQACKDLQTLATGLAQENVDPSVVQTVQKMYDVCHKITAVLGKGQAETGDNEPPAPATAQAAPAQGKQASAPQEKSQSQPGEQPAHRQTLDQATADLHQARVQHAEARRQMLKKSY